MRPVFQLGIISLGNVRFSHSNNNTFSTRPDLALQCLLFRVNLKGITHPIEFVRANTAVRQIFREGCPKTYDGGS